MSDITKRTWRCPKCGTDNEALKDYNVNWCRICVALETTNKWAEVHEDEREREVPEESMASGTVSRSCDVCGSWSADALRKDGKQFGAACPQCFNAWRKTDNYRKNWTRFVTERRAAKNLPEEKMTPQVTVQKALVPMGGVVRMKIGDGPWEEMKSKSTGVWVPESYPAATAELVCEGMNVATAKIADRRALVLGEARAQISLLRTWPACRFDHFSLNLDEVCQVVTQKFIFALLKCPECGTTSSHRLDLSPAALRALEASGGCVR